MASVDIAQPSRQVSDEVAPLEERPGRFAAVRASTSCGVKLVIVTRIAHKEIVLLEIDRGRLLVK